VTRIKDIHILLALGSVSLFHLLVRLLLSSTLQLDDAEAVGLTEHLSLGYPLDQPPLYTWMLSAAFTLFGHSLATLTLFKYTLIGLMFWIGYRISEHLFPPGDLRHYAIAALILMVPFAWQMHQGFTHSILLGLAVYMTLHAILLIESYHKLIHYMYLGVATGVGLLSKYSFSLFLLPLLLSAFTIPPYRKHILRKETLVSLALAALIALPHFIWLAGERASIGAIAQGKLGLTFDAAVHQRLTLFYKMLRAAVAFSSPLIFVYLYAFPGLRTRRTRSDQEETLLTRFFLIIVVAAILFCLMVGLDRIKPRWLYPIMMLFPFFLLLRSREKPPNRRAPLAIWGATIAFSAICAIGAIYVNVLKPHLTAAGRLNVPIMAAIENLPITWHQDTQVLCLDKYLRSHLTLANKPGKMVYQIESLDRSRPWIVLWHDPTRVFSENYVKFDSQNIQHIDHHGAGITYTIYYLTG
jgi:4-amino-4-deoxy-L-arabinose transferase-like glycosyltransferase